MLNQLPGHPWHLRWFPREDVAVSPEEVDERVFLFGSRPTPMVVVLLLSPVPRSIVSFVRLLWDVEFTWGKLLRRSVDLQIALGT
jgi:hypothetical protein